jgi:DNA/RNA-binding domain of Phe-tRNA-synthetase-like protein
VRRATSLLDSRSVEADEVIIATDSWKSAFPGAVVGALVMSGVHNPEHSPALDLHKHRLEEDLRRTAGSRAGGPEADRVLRAYADYYRSYGNTYHVKAQWESVAVKGKPIPGRAALVEAMFMAELKNLILTAGHDFEALARPVRVVVTRDGDRYVVLGGKECTVGPNDMMMADRDGIISSVLHGPDRRTRITAETREVLFAVYGPAGVDERDVRRHLQDIQENILLVAPEATTELVATLSAD